MVSFCVFWSILLVRYYHTKNWPYILWGKINVKLGINIAVCLQFRYWIFGQFLIFKSPFVWDFLLLKKFGHIRNGVKNCQIWENWLSMWPWIPRAGDSWPTYITSITSDKWSNAPKNSKENSLNKSVTSS